MAEIEYPLFVAGDSVYKVGGDYTFEGTVVAVFKKRSGVVRLVVEDDRGVLHIYSQKNLRYKDPMVGITRYGEAFQEL